MGAGRTAHRDVAGYPFVIPVLSEEPERGGHVLLHPLSLGQWIGKGRDALQFQLAGTVAAGQALPVFFACIAGHRQRHMDFGHLGGGLACGGGHDGALKGKTQYTRQRKT